jgi:hypothetical protein
LKYDNEFITPAAWHIIMVLNEYKLHN